VIGADGKNSVTRKVLLNEEDETEDKAEEVLEIDSLCTNGSSGSRNPAFPPLDALIGQVFQSSSTLRFNHLYGISATMSIPISLIQSDPELASFLQVTEQEIYV
jgi:salicylate hydroxylase